MDISEKIRTELVLLPQTITASSTSVGTGVERTNYEGAMIACSMGKATGGPAGIYTVTFQVQDSDDNSTYTSVTSGLSAGVGVVTNTQSRVEIALDLIALKKYIKVEPTAVFTGGTAPYVSVSALAVFAEPKVQPV